MSQLHRIRIRYTKEGRVRFVSARDLGAVWERAVRRAGLPIAWSEGFTPHPKISFPDALPLGYASTGEYAELTFASAIDADTDLALLSDQLPEGMDILTYWEVPDGAPKLAKMLPATLSEIVHVDPSVGVDHLQDLIEALLERSSIEVTKHRPSGDKVVDIRPAIVTAGASPRTDHGASGVDGPLPVIRAIFRNDGPSVRPTDLHAALRAADPDLPDPRLYRRVAQGEAVEDGLLEALGREVVEVRAVAEVA